MDGGPVWQRIRDTLRTEIETGRYETGARLPSEAELSRRFAVNRHTVRRALADLAEAGTIHVRKGAGAFVMAPRMAYPLGRRTRFSRNISEIGREARSERLRIETVAADAREAEALGMAKGAPVVVTESVNYADEVPVSYARSVFPVEPLPGLAEALATLGSVTAALTACGVEDYIRASTRLIAERAEPLAARHLAIQPGAPVLHAIAINTDGTGRPVEYGRTWFAGDRVELTVEPHRF
ncbi:MAG: phosphonate metabolism transcriptional regulator PhnF [Rubricella sp.]